MSLSTLDNLLDKVGLPPWDDKYLNAFNIYVVFFLGRYVSEDIKLLCGNIFDTPVAKTGILFVVLYNACRNARVALFWTIIFLVLQWIMSRYAKCQPYKDKGPKDDLDSNIWVTSFTSPQASVPTLSNTFSTSSSATYSRVVPA
jgi:hypothetical protein